MESAPPVIRAVFFDVDFTLIFPGPTFQAEGYRRACAADGIAAGYPLGRDYPEYEDCVLVAITERTGKAEIDRLAESLERAVAGRDDFVSDSDTKSTQAEGVTG